MRLLELFSGTGNLSRIARLSGWEAMTVDNDPSHCPSILSSIIGMTFPAGEYDLIWASPPCQEYSREDKPWTRTGKMPDFTLWNETLRIIRECAPRFWCIENVRGAMRYWGRPPMHIDAYYLWGYYPLFNTSAWSQKEAITGRNTVARARLPDALCSDFLSAVRRGLK